MRLATLCLQCEKFKSVANKFTSEVYAVNILGLPYEANKFLAHLLPKVLKECQLHS